METNAMAIPGRADAVELRRILGGIDDIRVAAILSVDPTIEEIE